MHITEPIARRKQPLVSIETTPPEKGRSIPELFGSVDRLLPFHPTFIAVTYHQQRIVYEDAGAEPTRRVPRRKNPGTVGSRAAVAIGERRPMPGPITSSPRWPLTRNLSASSTLTCPRNW